VEPDEPPPPQATRDAAAMALPARRPIRVSCGFIFMPFRKECRNGAVDASYIPIGNF
jgi:hypothetical protein